MRQRFLELGGPTHPKFGRMVDLSSFLDKFIFIFRQSAAVPKHGGPKTIGVEIWAKIGTFCPCEKGATFVKYMWIFYELSLIHI